MKRILLTFLRENRSFILFVVLMMMFRSAIADWNDIPSGSMNPTIVEGDRVFVNKMAYDLRVPFTTHAIKKFSDPKRGDIIVFESKVSGKRLIKRVVGVPGDRVALEHNRLLVNGEPVSYRDIEQSDDTLDVVENLMGVEHKIRISRTSTVQSSFNEVLVPKDFYLALGDNRDNSADSRVIGFVPRQEIVGRSRHVAFSLNYDNYLMPRSDRFFQRL